MKGKVGGYWNKIFLGNFWVNVTRIFYFFSGLLDWTVLILVCFERSLYPAQVKVTKLSLTTQTDDVTSGRRDMDPYGGYGWFKLGAKKITFTACHSGNLKLAFPSSDAFSTSLKSFLMSRIDLTVLLLFKFLKKHHLPVVPVKNRIH